MCLHSVSSGKNYPIDRCIRYISQYLYVFHQIPICNILDIPSVHAWDFASAPVCRRFRQTTIRPQAGSLWSWILWGPFTSLFRGCCEAGVAWVQAVLERQQNLMLSTILQSPQGFLLTMHLDWKGCSRIVWDLVDSWKSNHANQGFWQKRCPLEAQSVQWACGLCMVGTCYLEIGKGSPEPREANPCWLHVTTWDVFCGNVEISNSTIPHWAFFAIGELRAKLPVCSSDWIPLHPGALQAKCNRRSKMLAGICHLS